MYFATCELYVHVEFRLENFLQTPVNEHMYSISIDTYCQVQNEYINTTSLQPAAHFHLVLFWGNIYTTHGRTISVN